ncbi:PaaI family thioesterase [Aeromicrobium sp. HA]|uniref:PaaI family thioesterase n=1 Tax=Aeromicrobium sp. HA TaxID=3009077 RepID=UPI003FA42427
MPSRFLEALGLEIDSPIRAGEELRGSIEVGPDHHTPWGIVHGGVWATVIESLASTAASAAVEDRGEFAVGIDNVTDFVRAMREGRAEAVATPVHIGRQTQMWSVTVTGADGRVVASGRVRLANQPLAGPSN